MELKKNYRVMYNGRIGTITSNEGYFNVKTKERYIDVLLDGEKYICPIKRDCLKKIEDEKILTENKLHNLEIYKNINIDVMFSKLIEEVQEVDRAILNLDKDNLIEELLDVMQVCVGIAYTQNINLDEHIEKHNLKLLSRNHEFID